MHYLWPWECQPKPDPIEIANEPQYQEYTHLKIYLGNEEWSMLPINSIVSIKIFYSVGHRTKVIHGEDAAEVVKLINFTAPIKIEGSLAAIVTGKLVLTFTGDRKVQQRREFLIYNDRILQDKSFTETYYRATELFRKAINAVY